MSKCITFLLFGPVLCPGGGMKIILEYSNRLVQSGYKVNIVYPATINWKKSNLTYKIKSIYHYFLHEQRGWKCNRWFNLDSRVNEYHPWNLDYKNIPESDIYIATEVRTASYVAKYPINKDRKYYFIQDFENWHVTDEEVRATYHLPLNKIVIANWLSDIITNEEQEECTIVKNAFDFNYFKQSDPIENRDSCVVGTLYNPSPRKDINVAFNALDIVHKKFPTLKVLIFGTSQRPVHLPEWYEYHQNPTKEEHNSIYNKCSIFIGSSKIEGWGLTIGEAMMCGAAIACTDNGGYLEMAHHMENALVSPIGNAEALAENIIELIEDDDLRFRLANNGVAFMKQFSWDKSFNSMLKALGL